MMHRSLSRGFTLVEMLVIAPIVILSIGAFIALIVNLSGEVLSSRGSNVLAYEVQDALNRIEEDVKLSVGFLSTTDIDLSATNPQGYGTSGSTIAFSNIDKTSSGGSPASLIIKGLVTDQNPQSIEASALYLANSPNECNDAEIYSKNRPVTMNIVYFVYNDALWRRVIMPQEYQNAGYFCGSNEAWQQPSCQPGDTQAFCKADDMKLIEGVNATGFLFDYFTAASSTTPQASATSTAASDTDRNQALATTPTVSVTINAKRVIAGRDVERSGTLRVSRLDTNASSISNPSTVATTPTTPIVAATVSDGHNVNFTWPQSSNATSYSIDYRIRDGITNAWGSWTTGDSGLSSNDRSYTVTAGNHLDTVEARVRAYNTTHGTQSSYATQSVQIPLWASLTLTGGWTEYGHGYSPAQYTRTKSGVVLLRGLIRNTGTATAGVFATLPTEYRPSGRLIFGTSTNPNTSGRIDIQPDGGVNLVSGDAAWLSLETIRFVPDGRYTRITPTLLNGFINYAGGGNYAPASYLRDDVGRTHVQGLLQNGNLADGTDIFTFNSGYRSSQSEYLHLPSRSTGYSHIGITSSALEAKGSGSTGYYSINASFLSTSYTGTWNNLALQNGYTQRGPGDGWATPQYTKAADGLVSVKGLLDGGNRTYGTVIANLPAGFRPSARILGTTAAGDSGYARLDVLPNGDILYMGTANNWYALDSIMFYAEQ